MGRGRVSTTEGIETPESAVTEAGPPVEDWDAVVVGGGIAGLSAAWELTRAGLRPLLVEARGYTGGLVAGGEVGGVRMDLGAEGFVMRGEGVTGMVDALGLEVAGPSGGGARLFLPPRPEDEVADDDPARGWHLHRFIKDSYLGIPSNPRAADVVEVVGREAAERAARDAELPGSVGTGPGDPADLASFVAARMGEGILDRLVRPIVAGIHTSDPSVLAADTVAPGLREATARLGSLQAAVGELVERRRARKRGGKAVDVTTRGGLVALTDALREAVVAAGGEVRTRTGAQWLRAASAQPGGPTTPDQYQSRTVGTTHAAVGAPFADAAPGGLWELAIAPTGRGATPSAEPVPTGPERIVRTNRLVLACSAAASLRLLGEVPGVDTAMTIPVGSPIARFTLVAHAPTLAGTPVGSGLLVAPVAPGGEPAPVRAKALSHLSVKWPWIGEELRARHGEDVQALRLSYGRPGEPRPEVDLAVVLDDVEALTGVRIAQDDVVDSLLVRWDGTLPPVTPEHRARTQRLQAEAHAHAGLAVTGAWVAGTGVAAVVAHAREQAARLAAAGAATGAPADGSAGAAPGMVQGAAPAGTGSAASARSTVASDPATSTTEEHRA